MLAAETNLAGVALLALGGLLLALSLLVLWLRQRTRAPEPEVPNTMRPGPSDVALETPLLNRMQGWSLILVAFLVVWFPITWLIEPDRNLTQDYEFAKLAEERGARAVLPFSEENQLGVGCTNCHGSELQGSVIRVGEGFAYPPDLRNLCAGNLGDPAHPAITSQEDIYQVLYEGRNAMPSWSIRFAGALTDQQINDIIVYLIEMSSENVPFEDNVCLNVDAQKLALEKAQEANTVLERP